MRSRRAAAALFAAVVALVAAAPAAALDATVVARGLRSPVHVAWAPGDPATMYVVERAGRIRTVVDGTVTGTLLDISAKVESGGEKGLLSVAFPPDHAATGRFHVFYTADAGTGPGSDLVVEERRRDGGFAETLRIPHPGQDNHNGGQLQFGPDGHLWVATGDGGGANDPFENAENPARLLGKLLRIAPTPGGGYAIPAGNPYVAGGGAPEVWVSGLRNPWRFSFDRATGDLVVGDVGQDAVEELDHVRAADGLGCGGDFGWDRFEGSRRLEPGGLGTPYLAPLVEHTHDPENWISITGGYVARDPALAEAGRIVYGDFGLGELWTADPATGARSATDVRIAGLSSFGEDPLGRLYAVSLFDGTVSRLTADGGGNGTAAGAPARFSVPGCAGSSGLSAGGDGDGVATPPVPGRPGSSPSAGDGPAGRAGVPPRLALARTPRRQRVVRRRAVLVRAACARRCTLAVSGTVAAGRRRFGLRRHTASLPARRIATVRLRLGPRTRAALRRALRRHRRARIRLRLRATDPATGLVTERTLRITVRG